MESRGKKHPGSPVTRWRCKQCRTTTTATTQEEFEDRQGAGYDQHIVSLNNARVKRLVKNGHKRWVITAAQNNTRVHPGWHALKNYCRETGAELLVIPVHHKNISLYTAVSSTRKLGQPMCRRT
jgi:hypothetical protein